MHRPKSVQSASLNSLSVIPSTRGAPSCWRSCFCCSWYCKISHCKPHRHCETPPSRHCEVRSNLSMETFIDRLLHLTIATAEKNIPSHQVRKDGSWDRLLPQSTHHCEARSKLFMETLIDRLLHLIIATDKKNVPSYQVRNDGSWDSCYLNLPVIASPQHFF